MEFHYPDCSMGIGMDYPLLSRHLQNVMIWNQGVRYKPAVLHWMKSFTFDYRQYSRIWKQEHLFSFRTQPAELRSGVWPGGRCAFNLILASNTSLLPQLIMHTASSFMLRNLHDPFFIHSHDNGQPQQLLLKNPAQGIKLKVMSNFNPQRGNLALHNVCYFCN